ncbi:Uncharacterised protein [Mycobacteroides abscessus subsp. abscessus]|nr:Uncharacterised protein [Mycobacteroides abscessus subsp. abscessus]
MRENASHRLWMSSVSANACRRSFFPASAGQRLNKPKTANSSVACAAPRPNRRNGRGA